MGIGTSTAGSRAVTDIPNKNFLQFYLENNTATGTGRGMYLRLYHMKAGGDGEAARIFTTVQDVAASTAHGAHVSLSFGTTGTITGLGVANRNTLHLPSGGGAAGTLAAHQAEIWSDGSSSDPAGATEIDFYRVVNGGDTNGAADVDDDANLFSLQGFTSGSGNLFTSGTTVTPVMAATLRIKVGSTAYYIPLVAAQIT